MTTPLEIQICLYYDRLSADAPDYERSHMPTVKEALAMLCDRGLLSDAGPSSPGSARRYRAVEEPMSLYVTALCAVPMPRKCWVMDDVAAAIERVKSRAYRYAHDFTRPLQDTKGNLYEGCHKCGRARDKILHEGPQLCEIAS